MSMYRKLTTVAAVAALGFGLAACGGGDSDTSDAPATTPPPTPTPSPVSVSGSLDLAGAMAGELRFALPDSGNTAMFTVPAGETVHRQGVGFTCDSDYACEVTLENSLGTLVASWSSQTLGAGTADVTTSYESGRIPAPHGVAVTDANLMTYYGWETPEPGEGWTRTIFAGQSRRIGNGVFACPADGPDCRVNIRNNFGTYSIWWSRAEVTVAWTFAPDLPPPDPVNTFADLNDGNTATVRSLVTTPTLQATELTGMGLGGKGAYNADDAGLRSLFDPNSPDFDTGADTAAGPGLANALMGGSTLTGATDGIDVGDIEEPPAGWVIKTLFRDWGDTAGMGDGGFETGAIVIKNMGPPTTHPFDAMLAGRFVNSFTLPGLEAVTDANPYTFSIRTDGVGIDADNPATTVAFTVDTTSDTPGGAGSHVNANAASPGALAITVTSADDGAFRAVSGQYLGASGTYTCGATDCALSRESGTDNFTLGAGTWQFTPDAGQMVRVPDQDWMVYGAWMTTPDNTAGPHRIGRFYNGFDVYDAGTNFTATDEAGLHGTATYNGGATGIYVDGDESGLFTATATLTADFDVNGNDTQDDGDYSISGRIHDFRGTDGVYLGEDTAATPNDPNAGGENDWVVMLGSSTLADIGTAVATSGSADGLQWTGTWQGTLFGPAMDAEGDPVAPSGVAGQFSASTAVIPAGATGDDIQVQAGHTAVIGAFGATRQPPAN